MARTQRIRTSRERMDSWLAWDAGPATTASWVAAGGLACLLGVVILKGATGGPNWLLAWRIATLFLLYTGTLVVGRHLFTADPGSRTKWQLFTVRLGLLAVLLAVVYQSGTPGIGFGLDRVSETTAVYGAVVAFCVLADDPREYSQKQWLVLWCLAGVMGAFFYHGLGAEAGSIAARRPLWAAVVMGVSLAVLPRYLPSDLLLWTLSRVSAAVVLLGLATYLVGEYSLLGVQFRFHGTGSLPLAGREVPAIRSLLVSRNALAVVAVAGLFGAVAECQRTYERDPTPTALAVPATLLVVNAVGVLGTFGRVLWVLAAIGVGIYLASVVLGRDVLPAAVGVWGGTVVGGILLMAVLLGFGYLDADPTDRLHLWAASLRAILDRPSLLGEGMISTSEHILAYRDGTAPASPHNSYLSMWIRTGFVGGLTYLGLNVASVVEGVRRHRGVDVAVLALGTTFVAHQLFESYTLFSWQVGSVFASLAIGFLAFGVDREVVTTDEQDGASGGTATGGSARDEGARSSSRRHERAGEEPPASSDDGSEADPGAASGPASAPVVPDEDADESAPVSADDGEDASTPVVADEGDDPSPPVAADEESTQGSATDEPDPSPPVVPDEEGATGEEPSPPVTPDDESPVEHGSDLPVTPEEEAESSNGADDPDGEEPSDGTDASDEG